MSFHTKACKLSPSISQQKPIFHFLATRFKPAWDDRCRHSTPVLTRQLKVCMLEIFWCLLDSSSASDTATDPSRCLEVDLIRVYTKFSSRFCFLGATGMIGDPSGRNTERSAMELQTINHNLESIRGQIERVFDNHYNLIWKQERGKKEKIKRLRYYSGIHKVILPYTLPF